MSYNFSELLLNLKYLETSLIFLTESGDYIVNINDNGSFTAEFNHPKVTHKLLKNSDEVNGFFIKEYVSKVFLLNHDTDEETMVWVDE